MPTVKTGLSFAASLLSPLVRASTSVYNRRGPAGQVLYAVARNSHTRPSSLVPHHPPAATYKGLLAEVRMLLLASTIPALLPPFLSLLTPPHPTTHPLSPTRSHLQGPAGQVPCTGLPSTPRRTAAEGHRRREQQPHAWRRHHEARHRIHRERGRRCRCLRPGRRCCVLASQVSHSALVG